MFDSVHLSLLIGPGFPVPAVPWVVEAIETVRVTSGTDRAGFQITMRAGTSSPLIRVLLPAGYFDPIATRVIVIVTVRGRPHVLIDGVVTRHDVAPSNEPGKSTITITGEDLTVLMDLVEMPFMRFPAMPVAARIYAILAKYAAVGVTPIAVPPIVFDAPIVTEQIPTQRGTDLGYIRELASACGYVFYVEPGPAPGTSIGYFGPDVRIPVPQPALSVNMDSHTNVESLSFNLDGLAKKILVLSVLDPETKKLPIPVPVPNVSVLRPPLGARPTPPAKVQFPADLGPLNPAQAASKGLGYSFASSDAINGTGSLDVSRYGRPLRSRMLVGVRGAGLAYDGLYYVNSVTHDLKRGAYKQTFTISRDGLVSNTPVVPVGGIGP